MTLTPPSFSAAGYQARILAVRPNWLGDTRVQRIASVSTCTSEDPAEQMARNALGWFDTPDAARAACPARPTPIEIHGYRVLDVAWRDAKAQPSTLPRTSAAPIPSGWRLLGYDAVSRDFTNAFECSPLACNHRSVDFAVNADCLLPDLGAAIAAAEDFCRGDNAEPGTYYVVEVWSEPCGRR